jgi:cephalosporin hydroxylase
VPVSQFSPEFENLLALYDELRPKRVLEIGSQHGGSLWEWIHRAPKDAKLVNIDPMLGDSISFDRIRMWTSWLSGEQQLLTLRGMSQDTKIQERAFSFLGEPPDFCFIDGDHTYDGVKLDWQMYGIHSRVVAFHDLINHKPHFGIRRLFLELKETYRTTEFWSANEQTGGGIGVVFNDAID